MPTLTFQQITEKIDQLEEANILLAAIEFGIFSILEKRNLSAKAIARIAKTKPNETEMLLNALVAMGALRKNKTGFKNTSETYKYLCETSPHYKKGKMKLMGENRKEWASLIETIKKGRDLTQIEGEDDPHFRWYFTHAMHERSKEYSGKVANFVARKPVGHLIDLGGGPGSYSAAILRKDKQGTATLLDRPAAISVAKEILENDRVLSRFNFLEGDLFDTEFGRNNDTVLYSNILHIYNTRENKALFKKINRSLSKGGRFILVDLFLQENRIKPYEAALFSLTMLMFTATGKTYTFRETESLLKSSGFGSCKRFNLGKGSSIIETRKL